MKEQDFKILLTIYKNKNLSKAAEELYLTQPTLSYRVKQIEKDLDIILFTKGSNLIFTEEGEILVNFAKEKVKEFENIRTTLKSSMNNDSGLINIGVSTNFALYRLPKLLDQFLSKYPNINVTIFSGWSHEILDGLNDYDFQVGIVTGEYEWFDEKTLISQDPLTVISSTPIILKELPLQSRINYKPKTIRERRSTPLKPIESEIEHWWKLFFTKPSNIIMNIDTIETCKEMVKRGLGYSIIPSTAIFPEDNFYTYELKYKNGAPLTRNTYLLYKHDYNKSNSVNKFINFINDNHN